MNPNSTANPTALTVTQLGPQIGPHLATHAAGPAGEALREAASTCVKACTKGAQAMQAAAQAVEVDLRATAAKIAAVTAAATHARASALAAQRAVHRGAVAQMGDAQGPAMQAGAAQPHALQLVSGSAGAAQPGGTLRPLKSGAAQAAPMQSGAVQLGASLTQATQAAAQAATEAAPAQMQATALAATAPGSAGSAVHAHAQHAATPAARPTRATGFTLSPRASFYLLASLTISFLAGSLAPTPLYPIYQAQWGFSALTVTEIFGIYALALLASLLIFGRLSDHLGRRPVLIASTLMQVVVMGIFTTAGGVGALILGRVLQGIATGAALGAIGAGMLDIDKTRGPVANSVAPPLGTGTGGLIAGFFVHYLPAPTHLVYIALAAVFLVQVLGLFFMSETVSRRAGALASLKPQLALPGAARAPMLLAAPMLVAVWALAGFYGALVPALMRKALGLDPSFASGLAAFALAGSGALAVLLLRDTAPRKVMSLGTIGLALGTLAVVLSFSLPSTGLFFAGSVIAGLGFGAGFQGAMRTVLPLAKPHERAGVLSVLFVISYLAMGLPAIAAGFFVAHFGNLLGTAQAFSAGVMALALVALLGLSLGAKKN